MTRQDKDRLVGVLLIVAGALIALGFLSLGPLVVIAAVAAIVIGILVLARKMAGSQLFGICLVVAGALVVAMPYLQSGLTFIVNVVVGVILIVMGANRFR